MGKIEEKGSNTDPAQPATSSRIFYHMVRLPMRLSANHSQKNTIGEALSGI
jgi:hypothetical protein